MAEAPPAHVQMSRQLKSILEMRFKTAPPEIKRQFPNVVSGEHLKYFTLFCDKYALLVFVDDEGKTRIEDMLEQEREPFPGLITYNPDSQFLFKLDGAKNLSLQGCTVSGAFTFYYGEDSTIILKDHQQKINIIEWGGTFQYIIKLAYLVTYGNEITEENLPDFLDELIGYSINEWRALACPLT